MAMILDRTMMFGLTLRKVMPISSGRPTLAWVVLAWIQRLKYLANRTNITKATIRATTPKTIIMAAQSLRAFWASSGSVMGGILVGGSRGPLGRGDAHRRVRAGDGLA